MTASTDIIAGIESEIDTVLVLSGVTRPDDLDKVAYRPRFILSGVGEICFVPDKYAPRL